MSLQDFIDFAKTARPTTSKGKPRLFGWHPNVAKNVPGSIDAFYVTINGTLEEKEIVRGAFKIARDRGMTTIGEPVR